MAIGTVAETSDLFEVDLATKFNKTVSIGAVTLETYLLNRFYPIGAIFMSVVNTNPGTFMGGNWAVWGTGRVPVGVDTAQTEFNLVEETGGHKSLQQHLHSVAAVGASVGNDSPDHSHAHSAKITWAGSNTPMNWTTSSGAAADAPTQYGSAVNRNSGGRSAYHQHAVTVPAHSTDNAGSGNSQNLQPYITCYMWKRTA